MRRTLLSGLTTLLLPFAAYGAPATYGAYQRKQLRRAVSENILRTPSLSSSMTALPSGIMPHELSITAGAPVTELVIVDSAVPDKQVLRRALNPRADLVILDGGEDALAQITEVLGRYRGLTAVHVVSHGEAGSLVLGDRRIDREALDAQPALLAAFDAATRAGADLLLYGCDVASDDTGLLEVIQRNTHLDVAASSNPTGAADLGGDWTLEIHAGNIEATQPFSEKALKDFSAVLAVFGTKTFETWNGEYYSDDPSKDWDGFTTYISTPGTYLELISGITCGDDLYVSMYEPASKFLIRSNPAGDTFGVDGLSIRAPNSGGNPATQVSIFGYEQGNPTAVGTKSNVAVSATETAIDLTTAVTGSFADIERLRIQPDNDDFCLMSVTFAALDADGSLTPAAGVTEPVGLGTTVDTVGEAVDVFDFTLSDGGAGDGQPINVSQVVVHVSGTSTDAARGQIAWRLTGPDASNVTGTYDAGADTITFSGLSVSVADASSESYTINAYFNDNTNLAEGQTIVLGIDGDVDLTLDAGGTQMSGSNDPVTNGAGSTVDVLATQLTFIVQPAGSVSGNGLTTHPVVAATDAFGNTDADFAETITLTEASTGSLANGTQAAVNGIAPFSNLIYTATADQQVFTLTANDQDGVGGNLPTVDANAVTSDVVATRLSFTTQPDPTTLVSGEAVSFTTVPAVAAADANDIPDTGHGTDIVLSVTDPVDGTLDGTLNLLTGTGDTDGSGTTVTIPPTSGTATYTGLALQYTAGGSADFIALRATSGGLTAATSSNLTVSTLPTVSDAHISISGATGTGGAYRIGDTVTATWNNTAGGDNNAGISSVTVDFSEFGGGAAVAATNSSDVWTATYTVTSGAIDGTNRNVSVTATGPSGTATTADTTNATVDNARPVVTDANIGLSGATGSAGTFIPGDTVTVTWNNTAGGDNNSDTISEVSVDFSAFGGGVAIAATNSGGTWTATHTIVGGSMEGSNLNVSVSAEDNAGNVTTTADTTNATVDTSAPSGHSVSFDDALINAGEASGVSFSFSGAETGATYDYTIGSSGGGTPVTGSGTVTGSAQQVGGIDVSGLSDGTLSLSVVLTDAAGNEAGPVTASAALDATAPAAPSKPDLTAASDTGVSDSDDITSDATPTLAGTAEADATVRLSSDVAGVLGTTSATAGGAWTFTAGADLAEGEHQITADAIDAAGNTSAPSEALVLTIDLAPPDAADDTATTDEDASVAIDVLANDADAGSSLNPASVTVVAAPANGGASVNTANGVITYTPDPDFNGSDSFTYTVDDLHGGTSAPRTVSITVTAVNDAPEAEGDAASTDEDTPLLIDVAGNDTDVDDGDAVDPATIVIVTLPADGSAVLETGEVRYTPDADFSGTDQFTYTIEDGQGAVSNVATVMINVAGVNDAPQAADDTAATDEDLAVVIDVLVNDTDVDGVLDPASAAVLDAPEHGTTAVDALSGAITYTPEADFNGTDTFTYAVRDNGGGTSAAATVTVTVASVNDAPVAVDNTAVLDEDMPHVVNVLGNDSDVDGVGDLDPTTVEVLSGPTEGTATVNAATGAITYTPGGEFHGTDSLTYRVADAAGVFSNAATLTLTVEDVNDVPLVNDDAATTAEDTPVTIDVLANDSDVDGTLDAPSVTIVLEPAFGTAVVELDGTVTYTPDTDANGTDTFTYTVADDGAAVSAEASVSVAVTPVNDAPTIGGTPPATVVPGVTYLFTPTLTDADGDALNVSGTNLPPWLTLDSDTGTLSGMPSNADIGEHGGIVLTVSDGQEQASLPAFSIRVEGLLDSDGDGMPDEFETEQDFDPFDPADGAGDVDGDGVTNAGEYLAGTDPHADDYAPVIDAQAAIAIDAVGLLTPLPALEPPGAQDDLDGAVTAELAGAPSHLAPGHHVLTWRASDQAGNAAETEQAIDVHPLISLAPDQARGEGDTAVIRFFLNGPAPVYPLVVEYAVEGTADGTDHDLVAGTVTFAAGETETSVAVALADDGVPEGSETLRVTLAGEGNFGARDTHLLTIREDNLAPAASLSIVQGGREARLLTMDGGTVTFTAGIDDPNPADGHSYEWQFPSGAVATEVVPGQQALDPSLLAPGGYAVQLIVHDDGVPSLSGEVTESFVAAATAPVLAADADSDGDGIDDAAEGYGDEDGDGQPDHLDGVGFPNVLNERADDGGRYLIEAEPGVRLLLGEIALRQGGDGAGLTAEELTSAGLPADEMANVGGYFDFVVRGVAVGGTVRVAIPQRQPVPEHPLYRKFDGVWHPFIEDANNRLASAPGEAGVCPPPGSARYTAGLTPGDRCVELTLEDGGANDADRTANGSVEDPGGVSRLGSEPRTTEGGGGAFGWPVALCLMSFGALRRARRHARASGGRRHDRRRRDLRATHGAGRLGAGLLLVAAALMPLNGRADDPSDGFYLAADFGYADTDVSAGELEAAFAAAGNDDVNVTAVDAGRSAYRVALGYRLSERWSVEAGYVDLGEVDLRFTALPTATDLATVHPPSGEGVTLAGLYRYPLGERLALSARAGLLRWKADYVTRAGETIVDRHRAWNTDLLLGLGAEWRLSERWSIGLELAHYDFDPEPTQSIAIGAAWKLAGSDR